MRRVAHRAPDGARHIVDIRAASAGSRRDLAPSRVHLSFLRALHGEMLKLNSLKSTWIMVALALLLEPFGAFASAWSYKYLSTINPTTGKPLKTPAPIAMSDYWLSTGAGLSMAIIVVGVMGVLCNQFGVHRILHHCHPDQQSTSRHSSGREGRLPGRPDMDNLPDWGPSFLGCCAAHPFSTRQDRTRGLPGITALVEPPGWSPLPGGFRRHGPGHRCRVPVDCRRCHDGVGVDSDSPHASQHPSGGKQVLCLVGYPDQHSTDGSARSLFGRADCTSL